MGSLNSLIKKDEIKEPAPAPAQEPIQVPKKKISIPFNEQFLDKIDQCKSGDNNQCNYLVNYCTDFSFSNVCTQKTLTDTIKMYNTKINCNERRTEICTNISKIISNDENYTKFVNLRTAYYEGNDSKFQEIVELCKNSKDITACDNLEKITENGKKYRIYVPLKNACTGGDKSKCDDIANFCKQTENIEFTPCIILNKKK